MNFTEAYEEMKKGKMVRSRRTYLPLVRLNGYILLLRGFIDGDPQYDRYYLSCKDIEATDWEVIE